jgi:hypothetical protein
MPGLRDSDNLASPAIRAARSFKSIASPGTLRITSPPATFSRNRRCQDYREIYI